jgi:hypothetical protein
MRVFKSLGHILLEKVGHVQLMSRVVATNVGRISFFMISIKKGYPTKIIYPNQILIFFPISIYLVGYHIFSKILLIMILIYEIYVVIYQSNIGFEYEQLGFHIFCKKNAIMTRKRMKVNIKVKKKETIIYKKNFTCPQFHLYQKILQTPPMFL